MLIWLQAHQPLEDCTPSSLAISTNVNHPSEGTRWPVRAGAFKKNPVASGNANGHAAAWMAGDRLKATHFDGRDTEAAELSWWTRDSLLLEPPSGYSVLPVEPRPKAGALSPRCEVSAIGICDMATISVGVKTGDWNVCISQRRTVVFSNPPLCIRRHPHRSIHPSIFDGCRHTTGVLLVWAVQLPPLSGVSQQRGCMLDGLFIGVPRPRRSGMLKRSGRSTCVLYSIGASFTPYQPFAASVWVGHVSDPYSTAILLARTATPFKE